MDLFKCKYFYYYGNDDAISRGLSAVFLEKKMLSIGIDLFLYGIRQLFFSSSFSNCLNIL